MKHLILFLLIIHASATLGCSIPKGGPKYDSLIVIGGPDTEGTYTLSVPMKLEGHKFLPIIEMSYAKPHEDGFKLREIVRRLDLEARDEFLISSFKVRKEEGYKAFIHVFWPPNIGGMCGVIAHSKFLEVE